MQILLSCPRFNLKTFTQPFTTKTSRPYASRFSTSHLVMGRKRDWLHKMHKFGPRDEHATKKRPTHIVSRLAWNELGWGIWVHAGGRVNILRESDDWTSAIGRLRAKVRWQTCLWCTSNSCATLCTWTNRRQSSVQQKPLCVFTRPPSYQPSSCQGILKTTSPWREFGVRRRLRRPRVEGNKQHVEKKVKSELVWYGTLKLPEWYSTSDSFMLYPTYTKAISTKTLGCLRPKDVPPLHRRARDHC